MSGNRIFKVNTVSYDDLVYVFVSGSPSGHAMVTASVMLCMVVSFNKINKSRLVYNIGLDKNGYQVNSFLISQQKQMLWELIRSASLRSFLRVSTRYVFIEK